MNIKECLIFLGGKEKTSVIQNIEKSNCGYVVLFLDGTSKEFPLEKVAWFKDPERICGENIQLKIDGETKYNIEEVYRFEKHDRIFYRSGRNSYRKKSNVEIKLSAITDEKTADLLTYLKNVTKLLSEKNEEDSFLANQYEKVTFIDPQSVAAYYSNPTSLPLGPSKHFDSFFPFSFNLSQLDAVDKCFQNPITVIKGPPGTGKTQTILNIIANAVLANKTVAVVSNNNSATSNVLEKLEKEGFGFLAAFLGKNENVDHFFANQPKYPDFEKWVLDSEQISVLTQSLSSEKKRLKEMFEAERNVALLKQKIRDIEIQIKHFHTSYKDKYSQEITYSSLQTHDYTKLREISLYLKKYAMRGKRPSLWGKFKIFWSYGIYNLSFRKFSLLYIIDSFKKKSYEQKLEALKGQLAFSQEILLNFKFIEIVTAYRENSNKLFKALLAEKFQKEERPSFKKEEIWKSPEFEKFVSEFPVVLSTTHSLRKCISSDFLFDYLIVDEASQVDLAAGFLALTCTKNLIVVGDLEQLPSIVKDKDKKSLLPVFNESALPEHYNYAEKNLLSSVTELFSNIPTVTLREHYRCQPSIINFSNQQIYGGELIIMTEEREDDEPLYICYTNKGDHAREKGKLNLREIDVVQKEVFQHFGIEAADDTVAFISPFRMQAEKAKRMIEGLEADTVHKFQGREKRKVFFSSTANDINAFINNPNLLNVAITRAQERFILVTSEKIANSQKGILGELVAYMRYRNHKIEASCLRSIFDALYQMDWDIELKKGMMSPAEVLMKDLLEKTLANKEF